jgi:hypothetical protein
MSDESKTPICKICGKTLTRASSVEAEMGHRCDVLLAAGWTGETLKAHYTKVSGAIPEGYVKLAEFHRIVPANASKIPGLTISKLVKAIGKDRAVEGPVHPICKPIYEANARRTRWVNPWLATKAGLTAIATGDFSKAPKA